MVGKRKQDSGASKRKKKRKEDRFINSITVSIERFVTKIPDSVLESKNMASDSNLNNITVDDAPVLIENDNIDENLNKDLSGKDENNKEINGDDEQNGIFDGKSSDRTNNDEVSNEPNERENLNNNPCITENLDDLYDPGNWGENMSQNLIDLLVEKGPIRVKDFVYPVTTFKGKNRSFNNKHYIRTLSNGEKLDRPWLVYSLKKDKVFCFCCVLFKRNTGSLTSPVMGYGDWRNIHQRLSEHEKSSDHITSLTEWMELETRLKKKLTIDSSNQKNINREKEFWRQVLKRILCLVKALSGSNIAFRGDNEKIDDQSNGNFLSLIKMVAEFDPIMEEHLRRIRRKVNRHVHYLSHDTQNEMILLLASEVKRKILEIVKNAKYFSIILDCTPDVSHEEQMSLVLRCVDVSTTPIRVEEFFVEFIKVVETTGDALFNILKVVLGNLGLALSDVRGQGYDNGSNMKGHHKGVSSRVLNEYPRAFYTPCGCHSLNLSVSDIAMGTTEAKSFFGVIQRTYKLFSGSTKRWEVLISHVKQGTKGLTLKLWSDTRWESRFASVKAIRFQTSKIRDALLHLVETGDAITASDAGSLANYEFKSFDFLVGLVIWFEILRKVNEVSKILQKKDMDIDVCINLLNGLILFFKEYRDTGFEVAKNEATKIASDMGIEPKFREARVRQKKKFFDENARDEPIESGEKSFRINVFVTMVDSALFSLDTRFEQFKKYEQIFGFLFNLGKLRNISYESLKSYCDALEKILKHENDSDIDAYELFSELQLLRKSLPEKLTKVIEVLEFIKRAGLCFPNAWVAYRIILTIPVTVATAERSFSKLKLIKNYLRSAMSQDRLNGLAILSIEKKIAAKLDCGDLVADFAKRKARRV